jgi:5-oxoprolinase (ATP-hydrolysing)
LNNITFGDSSFGYYETLAGGSGAGPGFSGASAVHTHMTNTRITDPEVPESRYPVRLERFAIRKGSGEPAKVKAATAASASLRHLGYGGSPAYPTGNFCANTEAKPR